jgi:hypothetical protein
MMQNMHGPKQQQQQQQQLQLQQQQQQCPIQHAYPLFSSFSISSFSSSSFSSSSSSMDTEAPQDPFHGDNDNSEKKNHDNDDIYKQCNKLVHTISPSPPSWGKQSFQPGPWDVICGRGKQTYNHPGNIYFRKLVDEATTKYSQAQTKMERTIIVSDIIDTIRSKGNGFIQQQNKWSGWVEVDDLVAREKTGQQFRNSLGHQYKSSVAAKRRRRRQQRRQRRQQKITTTTTSSTVLDTIQNVLYSNPQVKHIMDTLTHQVSLLLLLSSSSGQLIPTEEEEKNKEKEEKEEKEEEEYSTNAMVLDKLCNANMALLGVFKSNPDLTKRFDNAWPPTTTVGRKKPNQTPFYPNQTGDDD